MHEALFYEKKENQTVQCHLCPHECVIADGKVGICGVRQNQGGTLFSLNYGEITSIALDPIEKKPLYHFNPGSQILSVGTKGCNLSCQFCQNWNISKDLKAPTESVTSRFVVEKAKEVQSFAIAYTYNEPFIWYEFVLETAELAKKEGLDNVLVTNGFVNPEPLEKILPFIDAMNVDIKSIDDSFYQKTCGGRVQPVLDMVQKSAARCHIEITNLIIPSLNDAERNFEELTDWIVEHVGDEVALHFSRYFPCYKLDFPPTPVATLKRAAAIAKKKLRHVYLGNV